MESTVLSVKNSKKCLLLRLVPFAIFNLPGCQDFHQLIYGERYFNDIFEITFNHSGTSHEYSCFFPCLPFLYELYLLF